VILIPVSRSFARRVSDTSVPQAGVDALIGMQGNVLETINPADDVGKVKVDGQVWRATGQSVIEAGKVIEVTGVRGAKLIVEVKQGQSTRRGGENG
jgi:membrane protein implicated in regulation of membrane protease activity